MMTRFLMAAALATVMSFGSVSDVSACDSCGAPAPTCCEPVCCVCPPAPVSVTWCVKDPVTCCTYEVTACVPACCEGVVPCYAGCRPGFLGRKILTYKFPCCETCVDVVITPFGRVIVRD